MKRGSPKYIIQPEENASNTEFLPDTEAGVQRDTQSQFFVNTTLHWADDVKGTGDPRARFGIKYYYQTCRSFSKTRQGF